MAMPEATMDLNNCGILGQNDIGATGKLSVVEPEPKAFRMQVASNEDFRFCILVPDS
jgi:hypothetical protein